MLPSLRRARNEHVFALVNVRQIDALHGPKSSRQHPACPITATPHGKRGAALRSKVGAAFNLPFAAPTQRNDDPSDLPLQREPWATIGIRTDKS